MSCPKGDQYCAVSCIISPVTQEALVEVNNASKKGAPLPSFVENGSISRQAPINIIVAKLRIDVYKRQHADNILIFCGVLLTSTLGCLISFQLPIFLNELDTDDLNHYLKGVVYGILGLLPILIGCGFLLHIDHFLIVFLPVILICAILIGLFFISFKTLVVVLTVFSKLVQMLGYIFFFLVCLTFFFNMNFTNVTLILSLIHI